MVRNAMPSWAGAGGAGGALALPGDVRLMNAVAALIVLGTTLALAAAVLLWLLRTPLFAIRSVEVGGEVSRNSLAGIAAGIRPRLAGNFFSIDLAEARRSFEALPWVRHAVVRRVWPDRLLVTLEEHHAAALWQGDAGAGPGGPEVRADRLVNQQGEVFEAPLPEDEDEGLPIFIGPEGSAAAMLQMQRALAPVLAPLKSGIDHLTLSSRGSWRVGLDSGARLELGRGNLAEVLPRTQRFVATWPQMQQRFPAQPLEVADLRHTDGYALRLRGVTTQANPANAAGVPKNN